MTTPARRCRTATLALFLLTGLLFAASPAGAVTVDNLYRAEVGVAGKGGEARTDGFRRALEEVLVKVSGSSAVRSNPDAEELLESAERFVQQFHYEPLEDSAGEDAAASSDPRRSASEGEAVAPTHRLLVQFAQGRVERALRERGIVVWGAQRPEILVWLAVDGDERRIVSSDGGSEARQTLVEHAGERGLPIMLPLMDMEDRSQVEFVDIQGGFLNAVQSASERYRPTALLIGHVRPSGDDWAGTWHMLGIGERKSWQATATALSGAVSGGVDGATDRVAGAFAGRGDKARELRLRVTEIDGLDAYARVSEYLRSLVRVRSADVVRLHPNEVVFRVTMNGRVADLERAITLGSTLARVRGTAEASGGVGERASEASTSGVVDPDAFPLAQSERGTEPARWEAIDLTFRLVG